MFEDIYENIQSDEVKKQFDKTNLLLIRKYLQIAPIKTFKNQKKQKFLKSPFSGNILSDQISINLFSQDLKKVQNYIIILKRHMKHIEILTFLTMFLLGIFYANNDWQTPTNKLQPNMEDKKQDNIREEPENSIQNNVSAIVVNYPVRLTYIDRISQWWPPEGIAAGIGVPGYAKQTIYNYVALAFWGSSTVYDIVNIWANPVNYFTADSVFGKTKDQIQKNLKKKYNDQGIKVLISAFGATQFPTTGGVDPVACAQKLAAFVSQNNLDGVDIDWEDNMAMEAGTGEEWLIKFQTQLRKGLPNHIITHAPQAPYFKQDYYKNGGYVTVHKAVGNTIDFYNVQFYNQGDTKYNTYQTLFVQSGSFFSGTAVFEIIKKGVPSKKIVIGKPVTQADAANTGLVDHNDLGKWIGQAYQQNKWYAGVMYWQYPSDLTGTAIKSSTGFLKEQCAINKDCK